jgi:hypothetical protein
MTGAELAALSEALRAAYPYRRLSELLRYQLNRNIEDVAFGDDYRAVMFQVLTTAEAEGWIGDLIAEAVASNPDNAQLARVARELDVGRSEPPYQAVDR